MPEPEDEMITFRIAPKDRQAIQRLIEAGEFRNRSDFLRYAVRSALDQITGARAPAPRLNLDLEGVELPPSGHAAGAAAQRPRPRAPRKGVGL